MLTAGFKYSRMAAGTGIGRRKEPDMATSVLQVQVDDNLKEQAKAVYEKLGIDLNAAVQIFLKQSVIDKGFPSRLKIPTEKEEKIGDAIIAIRELRAESEQNGNSDMTLDEINAEINAARAERHKRNAEKVWGKA